MIKTIILSGGEISVALDGAHAHIRNDGTDVIYAAKTAGITPGADGVASIPAGQADTIRGISGIVYLLGTGSAHIQSDYYVANPFKTSTVSGGSAVDEVARAAISNHSGNSEIHVTAAERAAWNGKAELSDIPSTLPANGGNADTAKQVKCVDIIGTADTCTYHTILDWANHYAYQGCSAWAFIKEKNGFPSDAPVQSEAVVKIESDDSGARRLVTFSIFATEITAIYHRMIFNSLWRGEWHTTSGGNAASVGTYTESAIAALEARIAALEAK